VPHQQADPGGDRRADERVLDPEGEEVVLGPARRVEQPPTVAVTKIIAAP
jgi:hypothetical protein